MLRLCVGGPLDGCVTNLEAHDILVTVLTRDGVKVSRDEYRHVVANPELGVDVEVYAHSTVDAESAVARAYGGLYRGVNPTTAQQDPRP